MGTEVVLALKLATLLAFIGLVVWIAQLARGKEKARREHAEDELEEVVDAFEDREAYDAAFQKARGRAVARARDLLRRAKASNRGSLPDD